MDHIQLTRLTDNHTMTLTKSTDKGGIQSAEMLELFAEELPEQSDMAVSSTFGCIGTCGTAGSTFSTLSSASSL